MPVLNNIPYFIYRRPRILNILHKIRILGPHSQMIDVEKACLSRYAKGKMNALEIGTYMGVSAKIIAECIIPEGRLFCVDPFERTKSRINPCYKIARRELKRSDLLSKVNFLFGYSTDLEIVRRIPDGLDFIFIDGDHTYKGLENDWRIVISKLCKNGIVCLHDTTVPPDEPARQFGSVQYFNEIIRDDNEFKLIETAYSMNVLQRIG